VRSRRREDLARIGRALVGAGRILRGFDAARVEVRMKEGESPVTEADLAADAWLRAELPRDDEGWLSEESPDDRARLARRRVWVVDPLDGTREFLDGVPEWCVSIGLVEDGVAVAGGIHNPVTGETVLGARDVGVTVDGEPAAMRARDEIAGAEVLVSRWALRGKQGPALRQAPFSVRPVGPVAWSLALVAAGRADATWSRSGKPEWDVAAGVALVAAAGGHVSSFDWRPIAFNRWPPLVPGIVACAPGLRDALRRRLG
jgi:myo-inositol-1(or 4)-monophosphatase